ATITRDKDSVSGERGLAEYTSRARECDIRKHDRIRDKSNNGIWKQCSPRSARRLRYKRMTAPPSDRWSDARVGDHYKLPQDCPADSDPLRDSRRPQRVGPSRSAWDIFDPTDPVSLRGASVQSVQLSIADTHVGSYLETTGRCDEDISPGGTGPHIARI